ncbi:MAG: hypothetical protein E7Z86_01965 [Methanosphaera stadtmanae]|jgi:hypothetical protein|nr:hypothetical protein [Methanosphaera stadtmanae]
MNDIEEALEILNNLTGRESLSQDYLQLLKNANLQETDGFLIKLKLNDEILSAKQTSQSVIPRLHYLIQLLSQRRSNNDNLLGYEEKLIIYLENQQDNKIICENCGQPLHFIDKYCYNCGQEQKTKITIIELLSSINSAYIKPGDIIRINKDYSIDKTTYDLDDRRIKHEKVADEINQLQYEQMNKHNIQQFYKKILTLNFIDKQINLNQLTNKYHIDDEEVNYIINELMDENLIINSLNGKMLQLKSMIGNHSNYLHQLTPTGKMLLKNNVYIIFYYDVLYETIADNIVEFEYLYRNRIATENLEDISVKLITNLRMFYLENNMQQEFNQTFNLEAFLHELFGKSSDKLLILLKRFIINVNLNYGNIRTPLDEQFIHYLKNIISSANLTLDKLYELLNQAYLDVIDDNIIIEYDELLNILVKCLEGYDINNLNFEIIQLYNTHL